MDHTGFNKFKERPLEETIIEIHLRVIALKKKVARLEKENEELNKELKKAQATPFATRNGSI